MSRLPTPKSHPPSPYNSRARTLSHRTRTQPTTNPKTCKTAYPRRHGSYHPSFSAYRRVSLHRSYPGTLSSLFDIIRSRSWLRWSRFVVIFAQIVVMVCCRAFEWSFLSTRYRSSKSTQTYSAGNYSHSNTWTSPPNIFPTLPVLQPSFPSLALISSLNVLPVIRNLTGLTLILPFLFCG